MFDIGFSEILLIAIVALVVLGPERLPRVARTAGHLLGRFQRYANQVKSDISREMQLEDIKKMQAEIKQAASDIQTSVTTEMASLESGVTDAASAVKSELEQTIAPTLDANELQHAADAAQSEVAQMQAELAAMMAAPAQAAEGAEVTAEVTAEAPSPQVALTFDADSVGDKPKAAPAPHSAA